MSERKSLPSASNPFPIAYIRPKQAARRYGVSISWLWAACSCSNPKRPPRITPPKKIGKRISVFDEELLDREMGALLADRVSPRRAA